MPVLSRYISALLPEELEPTLENAFNAGWPASVHIIGKVLSVGDIMTDLEYLHSFRETNVLDVARIF